VKTEEEWRLQEELFAGFVALALELDLPLNVHSRSAGRRAIALLKERGARRVLMHAFDGKASAALEGVREGYCFSVPPLHPPLAAEAEAGRGAAAGVPGPGDRLPRARPDPSTRNEPESLVIPCREIAGSRGSPWRRWPGSPRTTPAASSPGHSRWTIHERDRESVQRECP